MNNIQILGNITREIELRYTQSGTAISSFGIAYNEKKKDANGNYNDVVHFFDCTAFGKTAENINTYFHKGSKILIQGSLDYSGWTDRQGKKKSKVSIKVQQFDFVDKKSDNGGNQGQQNYNQQSNNGQTNQSYQAPQQKQAYQAPIPQYEQQHPDGSYKPAPAPAKQQVPPAIDIQEEDIPF